LAQVAKSFWRGCECARHSVMAKRSGDGLPGGLSKGNLITTKGLGHEEDWKSEYKIIQVLGKGSFGSVHLIEHKTRHDLHVIKMIDTSHLGRKEVDAALQEVRALQRLDHPHVLRLYEYELFKRGKKLYLILEALAGGDCKGLLKSFGRSIPEALCGKIVRHTLMATTYCHSMGVIHRDIKPENIMLTTRDPETCVAKVIDYGLAALFNPGQRHVVKEIAGTVYYMAPEVVTGKPFGDPADVWAIGVSLYQLLCDSVPFDGSDLEEVRRAISTHEAKFPPRLGWDKRSMESRDFIRQMCAKVANKRLTCAQALHHPWIMMFEPPPQRLSAKDRSLSLEGFDGFAEAPNFIKATLLLTAAQLDEEALVSMESMFDAIDIDSDGFITVPELAQVLQEQAPASKEAGDGPVFSFSESETGAKHLEKVIKCADMNGNGVIDFSEFIAACLFGRLGHVAVQKGEHIAERDILQHAFDAFDADANGKVSMVEVTRVLENPVLKKVSQNTGVDYLDMLRGFDKDFSFDFETFFQKVMDNVHHIENSEFADARTKKTVLLGDTPASPHETEEFEHGQLQEHESYYHRHQREQKEELERMQNNTQQIPPAGSADSVDAPSKPEDAATKPPEVQPKCTCAVQ